MIARTVAASLVIAVCAGIGCMAETPRAPGVSHPMVEAATTGPVCTPEKPTGSNIARTECREAPSQDDKTQSQMWRNKYPESPFNGPSQATDTPGLRVYH